MFRRDASRPVLLRIIRPILDSLLPPRCLGCRALVETPGNLCPACWSRISFITPPQCQACGRPFELPVEDGSLCGACLRRPASFARARAVFRYDDFSRGLVLAFKYADRTESAPAFALWMARAGKELLDEADMLVPVPLHWRRLFRRRYNQSALLARGLSRATGIPVIPDLLQRHRHTPPLVDFSARERQQKVRQAFRLSPRHAGRVENRRVVLVDDVLTSGATAGECARVLYAAGAANVDLLTLARVDLADTG